MIQKLTRRISWRASFFRWILKMHRWDMHRLVFANVFIRKNWIYTPDSIIIKSNEG